MWIGVALATLVGGCFPGGGAFSECREDYDCPSDQQCTRTRECVGGTLIEARLTWTIGGVAVTPQDAAACAGIDHLEISFGESGLGDVTYSPVPCSLGFSVYDKMPPRLDRVSLVGLDSRGALVGADSAPLSPGENLITLDVSP
jgi:hypothetical protein